MKKYSLILALVLISFVFVMVALAAAENPEDAFVRQTAPTENFNNNDLSAVSNNLGSCLTSDITYLKWDLVGVSSPISGASLTLNADLKLGSTGNLVLYRTTTDGWAEETITYNSKPSLGAQITSIPIPATIGQIEFTGTALDTYLTEENNNDQVVSFAIQLEGCTTFGPNGVGMQSKEDTAGTPPNLSLGTTNVALQSFRAGDNGISPVVWIGALLVVVLLVGAFVVVRRRPTNS